MSKFKVGQWVTSECGDELNVGQITHFDGYLGREWAMIDCTDWTTPRHETFVMRREPDTIADASLIYDQPQPAPVAASALQVGQWVNINSLSQTAKIGKIVSIEYGYYRVRIENNIALVGGFRDVCLYAEELTPADEPMALVEAGNIQAANTILVDRNKAACANIYGWFAQIATEEEWLDFMAWN